VQSKKHRRFAWLAIILAFGLLAAACGDDDDDSASSDGGSSEGVSGEVNVSGSSTVQPITVAAGEAFQDENDGVTVNVEGPGTGDGMAAFCAGDIDIADASRQMADDEAADCEANSINFVELAIGFDGITVMTNPNNDAVDCLSFQDLYALIGPESEGFANWSDGSEIATALGSTTQLPDADLALTGPGTESGTYDSFIELALSDIAESRGVPEDQIESTRTDYDASPDDNVIISNIEASDSSLGWVGFAFAQGAGDQVKELGVKDTPDGECVEPSAETIADGSYPLARTLYIYVNTDKAEENEAVPAFVDFYLDGMSGFVEDTGYVALPDDQAAETTSAWEGR
jgi:phosphate transport system substrate-binding protein